MNSQFLGPHGPMHIWDIFKKVGLPDPRQNESFRMLLFEELQHLIQNSQNTDDDTGPRNNVFDERQSRQSLAKDIVSKMGFGDEDTISEEDYIKAQKILSLPSTQYNINSQNWAANLVMAYKEKEKNGANKMH